MPIQPTPLFAANWKSNGTVPVVEELCALFNAAKGYGQEVVVCPSFLHIPLVQQKLTNALFQVGAQNCSVKPGAFTGEVNADMLADIGVQWVILGHSERRALYAEDDDVVSGKVAAALTKGLKVIACVGESLAQREANRTEEVVLSQLRAICAAVPKDKWSDVVIAYEPVWAIGTGKVATPEQAQDVHKAMRGLVHDVVGPKVSEKLRILYGGSVNAGNCAALYSREVWRLAIRGKREHGESFQIFVLEY